MNRYKIHDALYYRVDDFKKFFQEKAEEYNKTIQFELPVFMFEKVPYLRCTTGDRLVRDLLKQLGENADEVYIQDRFDSEDQLEVNDYLIRIYDSMAIIWSQAYVLLEKVDQLFIRSENYYVITAARDAIENRALVVNIPPYKHLKSSSSSRQELYDEYAKLRPAIDAMLSEIKIARRAAERLEPFDEEEGMDEDGHVFVISALDQLDNIEDRLKVGPAALLSYIQMSEQGEDLSE